MFSKKFLGFTLALLLAFGFYGATAKADVTGSFGVDLSFQPIPCYIVPIYVDGDLFLIGDQPCEETVFVFDFETALDLNITVSGLTMGIHSHAGVTGFEDIILNFATTLGALDVTDTFVFAQPFALGGGYPIVPTVTKLIPTCLEDSLGSGSCLTLFVKKRVETSISLGGVTFSNLAMFEDVNFPNYCLDFFVAPGLPSWKDLVGCDPPIKGIDTPLTYNQENQAFGFGDVITVEGQTPSGISVTAKTGICAEQLANSIKKHQWEERVDRNCTAGVVGAIESGVHEETFLVDPQSPSVSVGGAVLTAPTAACTDAGEAFSVAPVMTLAAGVTESTSPGQFADVTVTVDKCVVDNDGSGTLSVGDQLIKVITSVTNNNLTQSVKFLGLTNVITVAGATLALFFPPAPNLSTEACEIKIAPGFTTTGLAGNAGGICASLSTPIPAPGPGTPFPITLTWREEIEAGAELEPKPGVFFSFEKLFIEGIPLAAGLTLDVAVECGSIEGSAEAGLFFPCNLNNTITITGGPIFNSIQVSWGFEKILGPATFSDVEVVAAGGPLLLIIDFSPLTFTPTFVFAQANFTINPDTNPAGLRLRAIGVPGIVFADARLSISRAGLNFFADLDLDVNPATQTFDFQDLTFGLNAQAGIVTVAAQVILADHGTTPEQAFLLGGDLSFTVNF